MIISFDEDDEGITAEDSNLPNVIGHGTTTEEAMIDLRDKTNAIMQAVNDGIERLNQMGFNRREES